MNFKSSTDVSGTGGITRIGTCTINGEDIPCVEKVSLKHDILVKVLKNPHLRPFIDYYGPHVYHIDEENKRVYMEFIQCKTLFKYIQYLNILEPEDKNKFRNLIDSIFKLFGDLNTLDYCHNDLHPGNILACEDGTLKVIDLDDMKPVGYTGLCPDFDRLYRNLAPEIISMGPVEYQYETNKKELTDRYLDLYSKKYDEFNSLLVDYVHQDVKDDFMSTEDKSDGKYVFVTSWL